MKNLLFWVQTHKFTALLMIIVLYFGLQFFQSLFGINLLRMSNPTMTQYDSYDYGVTAGSSGVGSPLAKMSNVASEMARPVGSSLYPPQGGSTNLVASDRKVVVNSNFSLLVKDVAVSIRDLKGKAEQVGGFMVNSNINRPEAGGSGDLTVRVPSDQLDAYLDQVRGAAVRVVSENISGNDITDQYTDIEARLETLNNTKQIYQGMLSRATDVDEILRVQQSIFNVQDQIDSYRGQLQYLENTSKSSLVMMYLSTDELSLPYSPSEPWRPQVVFKTAVRSLMGNLRGIANLAIWGVVYTPIILTVVILIVIARRVTKKI